MIAEKGGGKREIACDVVVQSIVMDFKKEECDCNR
jgi:hypothetical protein